MKVLSSEGLTKLIQLIKGAFISVNDVEQTTEAEVIPITEVSLATVATTGAYSDLSGTPTIPTVNDATITIKQGGVTKGSFTLNQESNQEIKLGSNVNGVSVPDFTDGTSLAAGETHTIPGNGWIASNGTVRLDSSTGTRIISGGTIVWAPVEENQVVYVSGTAATFYPSKEIRLNFPDYTDTTTSLAAGQVHTIPFDGWIASNGTIRLGSSSGRQIISGGTIVTVPVNKDLVVYVSGVAATLYPCKQ